MSDLQNWTIREAPGFDERAGRFVHLGSARFPEDAAALFDAIGGPGNDDLWRYIPFGPVENADALSAVMIFMREKLDWRTHILREVETGEALGMASFMRNRPEHGSTEVGCIIFSKALQRTPAATEAMYLMASHVFDELGYRRYEWKCNNANAASKRAAMRLGFVFEGVFRKDMVVKGASRDTAWYSMTDEEWPSVRQAFEGWLEPANFDAGGNQKRSLQEIRAELAGA
ncbi:MAG: GNAT family protein [Pseudomonadota bacterium]